MQLANMNLFCEFTNNSNNNEKNAIIILLFLNDVIRLCSADCRNCDRLLKPINAGNGNAEPDARFRSKNCTKRHNIITV